MIGSLLPLPPIPAEASLRHFHTIPMSLSAIRDDLAALPPPVFRAAVLLWCAAWHQLPPGSLPNEGRKLAMLAQVPAVEFAIMRHAALEGWRKHSDGRLYHPDFTAAVLKALALSQTRRAAVAKRWGRGKVVSFPVNTTD